MKWKNINYKLTNDVIIIYIWIDWNKNTIYWKNTYNLTYVIKLN